MSNKYMKFHKGVTLVGALLAITILTASFVSILSLQVNIIRSKSALQNNNTANLLASEGVEIVRAIFEEGGTLNNGKYEADYTSLNLSNTSQCNDALVNSNTCDLETPNSNDGYKISNTASDKIFHRFIEISNANTNIIQVVSTVVVKNNRVGQLKVYKAYATLYTIN